ncbi:MULTISPECIES: hypothetical protein [Haloferax]|uniref:Uncharacterized protein n=1 Tax=Haloferax massiliensis TaxID=1476858 RepID=A0A0D6JTC0_9EURY|nr:MULTISPECIES: hypothetical protein [Haloferax]MDS0241883.1 hypothetical protein [Haloferax sp. S2CR25]MDS0445004.1 hypothetical protein [Haloferax sp. S2CR25-2]CQR51237.1 hypothetical protein BN996_02640 [Haloferax massiliensis]
MPEDSLFHEIINYRKNIYDNLASDSLSILSIQLFIIPLTISLISLVSRVAANNENKETSIIVDMARDLNNPMTVLAIFGMVMSISLSSITYYNARRKSNAQLRYLSERYYSQDTETALEQVYQWYNSVFGDHVEKPSSYEDVIESFKKGDNPGEFIRATLATSLFLTLSSLAIIFDLVVSTVFNQVTSILIIIGILTVIGLTYVRHIAALILYSEQIANKLNRFLISVLSKLVFSEDSLALKNPLRNLTFASVILLTHPFLAPYANSDSYLLTFAAAYVLFALGVHYQAKLEVPHRDSNQD